MAASERADPVPPCVARLSVASGGVTTTESYLYAYFTTGANSGKLQSVTLRRSTDGGSTWGAVRSAEYTYYDGSYAGEHARGNLGDLRTVTIRDAAGAVLDRKMYWYYVPSDGEADGYAGALKYTFSPEADARLAASLPVGG